MNEYKDDILSITFIIIIGIATVYIIYLFCDYCRTSYIRLRYAQNFILQTPTRIPETNIITTERVYILVIHPDSNINIGIQRN
jgi:hypothetical protein